MMKWSTAYSGALLATAGLVGCGGDAAPPLPLLQLDPARVAVAGISSGAYMAQQTHFVYSDRIGGAALLAGGPYGCAEGSLDVALSRCIKGEPEGPDAVLLAERARTLADAGKIAPLSGLDGDHVLVVHGKRDTLVVESVSRAAWALYVALAREVAVPPVQGLDLRWDGQGDFAHVWPTLAAGGECGVTAPPYIGRCGLDIAADIVRALFGEPGAPVADVARGELLTFDQNAFRPDGNDAGLDDAGFVYVPPQCRDGGACGLLVTFHGCEQNVAAIGDAFARDSGLNRWADAANLVVLYPQTRATYMPLNPKACWDWWGYTGPDYDTRAGLQLRWLANVSAALGVPLAH